MALDAGPIITRKTKTLATLETTTGTPIALSGSTNIFNTYNQEFTPELSVDDRPREAGFAHLAASPGPRSGRLRFEVDLMGSGASGGAAPSWAYLLKACGFENTGATYTLTATATAQQTATFGFYHGGRLMSIAGAQGNVTFALTAGRAGRARFEFLGKLVDPTDVALPAPTFPTVKPPRWVNGCTAHSVSLRCATAEITTNNELKLREDPNEDTGYRAVAIVDRRPTMTFDPESQLVAAADWHGKFRLMTTGAVSVVCGATANNIVTISSAAAQVIEAGLGNRDKLITDALAFLSLNDDLTVAFT